MHNWFPGCFWMVHNELKSNKKSTLKKLMKIKKLNISSIESTISFNYNVNLSVSFISWMISSYIDLWNIALKNSWKNVTTTYDLFNFKENWAIHDGATI